MDIGTNIKEIRVQKGLSTYALSKKTGISQSVISKLENGQRKADYTTIERLAIALGVSLNRLTGESVSSIIKNRSIQLGMSLADVAEKSGVSLSWLQNIENITPDANSYNQITNVANSIDLSSGLLRSALARQENFECNEQKLHTNGFYKNIGDKIKALRDKKGITQTQLAESIHSTKQTIYKYENNIITNIPFNKVEEIAIALETTPAYLMGWDDAQKESDKLYSIDLEIKQIAQEIHENPDIRELFGIIRKMNHEQLSTYIAFLKTTLGSGK